MSEAAQEIARLRLQFQQQAELIAANTQALQNGTRSVAGGTVAGTIGGVASGVLGGGLGLLSPLVSGILKLFGGGNSASAPAPLPYYTAPPSVLMNETLRTPTPGGGLTGGANPSGVASTSTNQASLAPQITVNVHAMDSQSFMDRSGDIASAVREAMLNLHPINDVVASL
jgi:hypothetical protein